MRQLVERLAKIGRPREPRLSELFEGFRLKLRAEGRSPATVEWYGDRLDRFGRFAHDPLISEISVEVVRRFLLAVKGGADRPLSSAYVDGHRKAVAAVLAWAAREGHVRRSPLKELAPYRVEHKEPVVLTEEEILRLVATEAPGTYQGERNRAMIATLYDTGLRVGELVRLAAVDVDLEAGTARVRHSKAKRERSVPLSPSLRALLWTYLHRWRPESAAPELFVSRSGRAIHENAVNQLLRAAAAKAEIRGKRVSPHTFRHTFATHYLRNGGDEFTLQRILGHSTLEMVRRYVHLASGDVAARHAQASPLERLRRMS